MNIELKALISLVFDAEGLVQALVNKQNFFTLLPQVFQMLTGDLPAAIMNWSDLMNEINALKGSAQEADLIAFIQSKFHGISNDKAEKILAAVLKLVMDVAQDALALKDAVQS